MIKIFYTVVGSSWIGFYSYRFLTEKLEQDFLTMSLITRYIFILISIFWIIFSICKLYILLKKNYQKGYLHKIMSYVLEQIYYRPLHYIWDNYLIKIPLIPEFVCCLGLIIYFFVKNITHVKLLILFVFYITRVLIVAILFIEIVFLKKLNLFYTVVLLSILTLIFNATICVIKKEFEFRCKILENNYLIIYENNGTAVTIGLRTKNTGFIMFENLVSKWKTYKNIVNICYGVEELRSSWSLLHHIEIILNYFTLLAWIFCFIFQIHYIIIYVI